MSSKALGLIETVGLAAAIEAADAASKAANVTLLGYENSKGGGLIAVKLVGDVGAVKAAIAAGSAAAQRIGKVAATHIIPRPHAEIEPLIQSMTRGQQPPAPA
jgi:microcompartment protein CcmL/EutN